MRRAQHVFVLIDLLQQILKRSLHRGCSGRSRSLHCHLTRRQAQVQRNAGALAGRDLLDHALQVDKFGTENLQAFLQFFDLMLDVFFYGGNFMKTVTDVNVHSASALLTKCATKCFLSRLYTRRKKRKRRIERLTQLRWPHSGFRCKQKWLAGSWAAILGLQPLERAGYDPGTMILSKLPLLALLTAFACAQAPSSRKRS